MVVITEAFLDNTIIEQSKNIRKIINDPIKEKIILKNTEPYEGWMNGYYSIIKDNSEYKMYYRGQKIASRSYTCIAISKDGLNFSKPKFNKKNNIIINTCNYTHNFFPIKYGKKYYAIAGSFINKFKHKNNGIDLLESTNGINWKQIRKLFDNRNVIKQKVLETYFDSLNVFLYDRRRREFKIYLRYNSAIGVRSLQIATTRDFKKISTCREVNIIGNKFSKKFSIYASNIINYPDSFCFIGFPMMQIDNDLNSKYISMIFSRDGYNWNKIIDKPLLQNIYKPPYNVATGLVSSNDKKKFYIYFQDIKKYIITCFSYRYHGIIQMKAIREGFILTKPLSIRSSKVLINFKTNRGGYIIVQILNQNNNLILTGNKMIGDNINLLVKWKNIAVIKKGIKYKLKFILSNSSLFSFSYEI